MIFFSIDKKASTLFTQSFINFMVLILYGPRTKLISIDLIIRLYSFNQEENTNYNAN